MRYEIIDSHRKMSLIRKEELNIFFQKAKGVSKDDAWKNVEFCEWYEKEFAVKWLEAIALDGKRVVGYLMCLRNPSCLEEWFIGDVYVLDEYRGRNIATRLYEKTMASVSDFFAAQRIVSSVNRENVYSIGLHKKMGFVNTKRPCEFPDLYFDENEEMYQFDIIERLQVTDVYSCFEQIMPLWIEYKKGINGNVSEKDMKKELYTILIQTVEDGKYDFEIIFSGYKVVGFAYWNDEVEIEYQNI